jgi:hypothetical protein
VSDAIHSDKTWQQDGFTSCNAKVSIGYPTYCGALTPTLYANCYMTDQQLELANRLIASFGDREVFVHIQVKEVK